VVGTVILHGARREMPGRHRPTDTDARLRSIRSAFVIGTGQTEGSAARDQRLIGCRRARRSHFPEHFGRKPHLFSFF
jgi:hypothetical protein